MLTSTILPLALAGAAASMIPSASASPVQLAGQAPSVNGPDGNLSHEALERSFKQAVERSVAQFSARSVQDDKDCPTTRQRSRKVKRGSRAIPLVNSGFAYLAQASIGTPAQTVALQIDTGSGDLLVPRATDDLTPEQGGFVASKSRTFRKGDGVEIPFTFAGGSANGVVVADKVQLGGFIKIAQPFGLIEPTYVPFGILGLSFSSIAKIQGQPTFFDRLRSENQLDRNLFGLYHTRDGASGSELTLGAADSSRYTGELTTIPVVSQTHWTVQMNHATLDGEVVYDGPVFTAVDSGTTTTIIPKAITDAYFARIPGSVANPEHNVTTTISGQQVVGQIYEYPCNATLPVPGFIFEGSDKIFQTDVEDAAIAQPNAKPGDLCVSSMVGADVIYYGQKAALIGLPFLKSWYSVFNFDDATVSFAAAKH
ncbi:hypothetical protein JCM16303_003522 [Sporobolomyces ruberrimus]